MSGHLSISASCDGEASDVQKQKLWVWCFWVGLLPQPGQRPRTQHPGPQEWNVSPVWGLDRATAQ